MMPIAIIWLIIDLGFIKSIPFAGNMKFFLIPFFALHLMPVWIWLGNLLSAGRIWKNTRYYITDKRIIIQSGFFNADIQTIYYKDIRNVNLKVGLIDKMLGVGDIHFDLASMYYQPSQRGVNSVNKSNYAFLDIKAPHEIYPIIQKTVMDIQNDIEFPNAYRPDENPGYNTKYKP